MSTDELQWRLTIPGELINSNEVHVWRVFLDVSTVEFESMMEFLSVDELARAGRFHFESDQRRFIMARGILRKILSGYLGMKPHQLQFEYTPHGKPVLSSNSGRDNLSFNLSHSGAIVLYAVTRGSRIGIDIERIHDNLDFAQIAQRFFSPGEISSLERMGKNSRTEGFFHYWARKEAFIKATGEGVSFPLEQCDVSLFSESDLSLIRLVGEHIENSGWYGQDLFPGHGYAAAIAVEGNDWELSCREYAG